MLLEYILVVMSMYSLSSLGAVTASVNVASTFLFFFFKSCVFRSPASRFGLHPCLPLLQHPICSSGFPFLDFIRVSLCSNVQSTFPDSRFWTSSVSHSASTSNPRFQLPGFGLLPCLTLLQRPIHSSGFPVLDFFRASLCSNVQFPLPASPLTS